MHGTGSAEDRPALFELLAAARPEDPMYPDAAANARHQLAELDADRAPAE